MARLKHTLAKVYEEYEEYVNTSLLYDDTEIDTFDTWGGRHYQLDPQVCRDWEMNYAV